MQEVRTVAERMFDVAADFIVGVLGSAGANHNEIRAKLAEYGAGAKAQAASVAGLVGEVTDDMVSRVRARYLDWLGHPRLGHGPWIDEGEAADVSLRCAIVDSQNSPTATNLLLLWLAVVRVMAITSVMGEDCVYSGAVRRRSKGGARRSGGKARRRPLQGADVPSAARALIEKLAFDEDDDGDALGKLESMRGTAADETAAITKIVALARTEGGRELINRLATDIRRLRFTVNATGAPSPTSTAEPEPTPELKGKKPKIMLSTDSRGPNSQGNEKRSKPEVDLSPEEIKEAEQLYNFCKRSHWAMETAGGLITLTTLDRRSDLNEIFNRIGLRASVQAQLRAIKASAA